MSVGMNNFEDRFRALSFYAHKNGFGAAFPTYHEAIYGQGKVYGAWLLKKESAEFRDIPANELGDPRSAEDRFRAANTYASAHGFYGAIPTFFEADYGRGKVYGTWLLKKDVAEFRDIPANELGDPQSAEDRFRAVNAYASAHGFYGAFPTFFEADYGRGKVYGAWLLKKSFAEFRDILFYDLLKMLIRPGDIIYGYEGIPGHVGIIVMDRNDKGEIDLIVREAYPGPGVANLSLKDFCENGSYHTGQKLGNYSDIRIFRAKCDDAQALKAAEIAKGIRGPYDWTYVADGIGLLVTALTRSPINAGIMAFKWKADWDNGGIWYCSKLVYKAYRRAGLDLYPKKDTCFNPMTAWLEGEYPYLFDGRCPWWLITPWQVCSSERVFSIWEWRK